MSSPIRKMIRAYHGSPYAFDKFDPTKIGSGEGAQAYGYGHYFAGNEDVARGYRDALSGKLPADWSMGDIPDSANGYVRAVIGDVAAGRLEPDRAAEVVQRANISMRDRDPTDLAAWLRSAADSTRGHMYDVTLGVNPEHLLNWDAPLSGQSPSVHRLFDNQVGEWKRQGALLPEWAKDYDQGVLSGRELYNSLGDVAVSRRDIPPLSSKNAVDLGIPGIQYLDGFSRNAGEGTSNYVMFPGTEDLININRRYEQGGPVNTPTEGEGGLYAAPNSTFDTPPPYEWGYRPAGAHADGGPVEMALGGTTPTSTGGQYQPRESEGPGFFRNQDNYDNSSAGDINFVKNFVQGLSPAQREAQRLVSEATKKSGKEALVFGRGENPADLAKLTQGTYENVSIPGNYAQYALQSADPFFSFHTHGTNTLSPSAADLRIWGATQPGTIGLPYQSMFINASPQDSLLRIGEPGKWMDSDAQRIVQEVLNLKNKNEDLVANHGFMDPRMREFWKGNKLPDLAHTFHAESDQMPGVKSYLDKKIPGAAQGASMRDLYAGNFLQRIAELGIPVDVSAEHRIAGTPYLAQDVWPEFAAHVKKHALPKAEGGPVEMSTGGQYDAPKGGGYIRNNLEDMYAGDPTQAIRGGIRTRLARQHQMDTPKGKAAPPDPRIQTVRDPERMVYPGIYKDPDVIAEEASKRLMRDYGKDGPMYRLFGQTRSSLDELSQGRDLEGMRPWPLRQAYTPPGGSTGSAVSDQVLTPRNARRLLDIHGEAMKYPGLRETRSWYEMSPLYQRMEELGIPLDEQRLFNQRTGIFSAAASPVSEINRGTLAHHLAQQGRIEDFIKYGGVAEKNRASVLGFPEDIMDMKSHAYHGTAQAPTLAEIEMSGGYWPKEHKVGTYIGATDPEFPNYTRPIADSHIARGVGYADVRPGKLANVKANLSNPEYTDFYPWWENKIAGQTGLRPRDEQAFMWNVLGPQTGVRYIGPSKLELMSNQMMKASKRLGVAPDVARDMVLRGEAGAYKEGGTVEDQYHPIWQQSFAGGGQPDRPRLDGFDAMARNRPDEYNPVSASLYPWLMDKEDFGPDYGFRKINGPLDLTHNMDNSLLFQSREPFEGRGFTLTPEEKRARWLEKRGLEDKPESTLNPYDLIKMYADDLGRRHKEWKPSYSGESLPWQTLQSAGDLGRVVSKSITGGLGDTLSASMRPWDGSYEDRLMQENDLTRQSERDIHPFLKDISSIPAMISQRLWAGPAIGDAVTNLATPADSVGEWADNQTRPIMGALRNVPHAASMMRDMFSGVRPTGGEDPGYFAHGGPVGYVGGGHAKDTGNTFDFLGPFGAGLNLIADGAGAIFGGEDFELDKALGYLGEIGGSLVAPGVGGPVGRGVGTMAAHLIEPGEGDVGRDALNAGYGALRGGMGMFFARGGSTGFGPQGDEKDPNDLTRFLSPQVNPYEQPDPMDWAASGGVPGAISPPLNANNGQVARDAAERQRLMSMAEGASKQALQSQSGGGKGGGGGGMGDLTQIASMAMKFLPMMMAAEGGPVSQDGEQPWMYGNGALMARGGYLSMQEGGAPRAYRDDSGNFTYQGNPVQSGDKYLSEGIPLTWAPDDVLGETGGIEPDSMYARMQMRGGKQSDFRNARQLLAGPLFAEGGYLRGCGGMNG